MQLTNFTILSEEEINQIHMASLDILENTGVVIHSDEVLQLLKEKGVIADHREKTAKFPRVIVERAIESVPSSFTLYDRNGKQAMVVGEGIPMCAAGHNAIYMIDPGSDIRRNPTTKDVEDFATVSEGLMDIDIVGVPVMPQDVTAEASLLYAVKALFENTTKPLFYSTESREINASIIRMMKTIAGKSDISECPNAIGQLSPTSPLFWVGEAAEALTDSAREGVPVNILPEPMSGVSAPYSVAGLLTVHNAEILSGVVIAQLANPGAPLIYGSSWTTFDMKKMNAIIGSPETSLLRIAGCQMAKFYNIPSHTTAPNSDSNMHDEQNAWEKAISNMCALCARNDIVMNSGMFATGLTVSLAQLVLDDETNGIIRRMNKGIRVDADTIASDLIDSVGPCGSFLMENHTLDGLRTEEFRGPKITAQSDGSCVGFAESRVRELLKTKAVRLNASVAGALMQIIADFEKTVAKSISSK